MKKFHTTLSRLFHLGHDQDDPEMIDETIRSGISVGGTNLWVLFFAILIASIGLNVNSTAVIIGAMLISPLMGPIVGVGYGAGVKDLQLIRLSLRNLGIFVAIGLSTATLYFLLTPLTHAQSELLARTSPTLWDVLIAFFGGAVGMIGATRRYSSNVVPGVAIATALMPPLCTAGYGIATGNLHYFGGAFYLFTINSVFIGFASLLVVKLLHLPERGEIDEGTRHRTRIAIAFVVIATAVPSGFLAYDLVIQKVFEQTASRIIQSIDSDKRYVLLGREISIPERRVLLTIGGEGQLDEIRQEVERQFVADGYAGVNVNVRHIGSEKFDLTLLKQELQQQVFSNTLKELQDSTALTRSLESEIKSLKADREDEARLIKEIAAQYPEARRITVGAGSKAQRGTSKAEIAMVVTLAVDKPISAQERTRLQAWLKARYATQALELVVTEETPPAPAVKKRRAKR
ncbi:MAG: hypothetical protein CVU16_07260 [Betaproteobacteria bacterium HGW-Betaproteobacteria-10]|nr:MAG: hypothetical protein CVU16_07260 [Betaproteobacteria bacterium HGW-Betaproteobacteria-10]